MDLNKWLIGSGCCTALGVAAGFVYLYGNSADTNLLNPQWYQQPLLLFFTGMLLLALVLNVLAMFGVEFRSRPVLPLCNLSRPPSIILTGWRCSFCSSSQRNVYKAQKIIICDRNTESFITCSLRPTGLWILSSSGRFSSRCYGISATVRWR